MTNGWNDIKNADVITIMGGNAAEAHPCGFKWVTEAMQQRKAKLVVVDRTGVLGELYALADAAFVGGGFHAAGLHSVLEPAAYGVPVAFGPMHRGSREAGLLIRATGAASARGAPRSAPTAASRSTPR